MIGVLKGLAETARNWFGSYYDPQRYVTISYPEQKLPQVERVRNFPFLIYDKDPESGTRCVACQICEKECPPQCILIVPERDENGKLTKRPKIFDIDISVCMSCRICVDVCPFDAIRMDNNFEISTSNRFEPLIHHKEDLLRSNEYYHTIHPVEASETDARLLAEKQKKGTSGN